MNTNSQETPNSEQAKLYDVYLAERAELNRGRIEDSHAFDKTLTSLSAGAIAFSLTYIQVFFQNLEEASGLALLYSSWCCFVLSLVAILTSFLTSQRAYSRQITIVEQVFLGDCEGREEEPPSPKNGWTTVTHVLNLTSFFAFVAGVVTLSAFALMNLP